MTEYIVNMYCEAAGVKCEEVVRCRDCKWSDAIKTCYQKETVYACLNFDSACVEPDGFCAWGERRENGNS